MIPTLRPPLEAAVRAARETRHVELGAGALARTPQVFRDQFGGQPAWLVADPRTWTAAGEAVAAAFRAAGHPTREPLLLRAPDLYAESRFVDELTRAFEPHRAIPVAVGSGTINDLVKLAAHRTDRPYLCVATAASMDGYTAFGASITHAGMKQTFHCPAPAAVVADLAVLAAAPGEMNAWGYADLLAKVTAGADWLLADALGVEPIEPRAWELVQGRLREWVAEPARLRARDPDAIARLMEGLMLGGFAMQQARSSRPASGAEHQFSHLWDMQHHTHNGRAPSHGSKVGIGTLAVTALYERLLAWPLEQLDVDRCCAQWPDEAANEAAVRAWFGDGELAAVARQESRAKAIDAAALRTQLQRLRRVWPELRERLRRQLVPAAELKARLRAAGAPTEPEQIGLSRERLRASFRPAYFIRRRFTVLDLAVRAGVLDACLEQMFGANAGAGPEPGARRAPPARS
jgi:glycerol-1-phosphate dehydrogenase [NAD(P)+]